MVSSKNCVRDFYDLKTAHHIAFSWANWQRKHWEFWGNIEIFREIKKKGSKWWSARFMAIMGWRDGGLKMCFNWTKSMLLEDSNIECRIKSGFLSYMLYYSMWNFWNVMVCIIFRFWKLGSGKIIRISMQLLILKIYMRNHNKLRVFRYSADIFLIQCFTFGLIN